MYKESSQVSCGEIEKIIDSEYQLIFLRKKGSGFVYPTVVDKDLLATEQIEMKLPKPKQIQATTSGSKKRKQLKNQLRVEGKGRVLILV